MMITIVLFAGPTQKKRLGILHPILNFTCGRTGCIVIAIENKNQLIQTFLVGLKTLRH